MYKLIGEAFNQSAVLSPKSNRRYIYVPFYTHSAGCYVFFGYNNGVFSAADRCSPLPAPAIPPLREWLPI